MDQLGHFCSERILCFRTRGVQTFSLLLATSLRGLSKHISYIPALWQHQRLKNWGATSHTGTVWYTTIVTNLNTSDYWVHTEINAWLDKVFITSQKEGEIYVWHVFCSLSAPPLVDRGLLWWRFMRSVTDVRLTNPVIWDVGHSLYLVRHVNLSHTTFKLIYTFHNRARYTLILS